MENRNSINKNISKSKSFYESTVKNMSGITLVALVVTIIILIILAGVSISIVLGENGLITKAKGAKQQTEIVSEKEGIEIAVVTAKIGDSGYATLNQSNLQKAIDGQFGSKKATVFSTGSINANLEDKYDICDESFIIEFENGRNYFIDNSENIICLENIELNDVYVYLDDNNTLVFSSKNTIEGRNIIKSYGNIKGQIYKVIGTGNERISNIPWFEERHNIKHVEAIDKIQPLSTSAWFFNCINLEDVDLTNCDTSNVIDMSYMFWSFDSSPLASLKEIKGLENFNTSNVKSMNRMFSNAIAIESLDVSNFNTSNVTDMQFMFGSGKDSQLKEIIGLENFDTHNVTNMRGMFNRCSNLTTLNISNFDTSNVTTMEAMFFKTNKLSILDVSNFNTSKVTNMIDMFNAGNDSTNIETQRIIGLENFDTSNVTSIKSMFAYQANLINLDLSGFDTSNVIDMSYLFINCKKLEEIKGLEQFKTQNVTEMQYMFQSCPSLREINVSSFNTCKVTNMRSMFNAGFDETSVSTQRIFGLENFDTSNVTSMRCMFQKQMSITSLDLSSFDTSKVIDMNSMFYGASNLAHIYKGSKWTIENVTDSSYMFNGCGTNILEFK